MTLTVLIAASIATHAQFHRPVPVPHILAVNTHFGGQSPHDDIDSRLEFEERTIQQIALAHPDTLLVFPESIIPSWNGMHEARWAPVLAQLETQRTGLLIGTDDSDCQHGSQSQCSPLPRLHRTVFLRSACAGATRNVASRRPAARLPADASLPANHPGFGIAVLGYWSATSNSHSGRPSKLLRTTPTYCSGLPTSTGRRTHRSLQFSTLPRRIGPTSGPFHSTRQATDENSDSSMPALLCRKSLCSTSGRCRSPIALPVGRAAIDSQRDHPR